MGALSPRIAFRHPLVRSAIYRAAAPQERREVHRALAEATDPKVDPDRRAWHRAHAAFAPDEHVAAELEHSAARAQGRGGFAAAAALLERAVDLSPEPARRAQRALAAAQTKFQAGAIDDALDLLAIAESGTAVDVHVQAHVHLLRGQIAFALRRGSTATPLLLAAAHEFEAVDPALARATYLDALSAAVFAGRLAHDDDVVTVSEAALAGPAMPPSPSASELLLHGLAVRFTEGYAAGAPLIKEAVSAFQRQAVLSPEDARWLWFASLVALFMWETAGTSCPRPTGVRAWRVQVAQAVRGSRRIPLADELLVALAQLRATAAFLADDDLVFGHPETGKPLRREAVRKRFQRACRRAGVRVVRFHDLRHTFGTGNRWVTGQRIEVSGWMHL